jgi:hypothetical protein
MIEGEIIHLREVWPGGLWIVGREQIRWHAPRTIALDDAVDGHIPDSKLCNIHLDFSFYLLRMDSALRFTFGARPHRNASGPRACS